jgi:hypothetical protein
MALYEKTIYPRLVGAIAVGELKLHFTPTAEETDFADQGARSPGSRLTLLTLFSKSCTDSPVRTTFPLRLSITSASICALEKQWSWRTPMPSSERVHFVRFVLAALNHPNIAQIHAVEDRALVMELVEGETLRGPALGAWNQVPASIGREATGDTRQSRARPTWKRWRGRDAP